MDLKLIDQIRECPSLPTFPAVALEVLKLTSSDETELAKIADVISNDAALTGKVLRTVNSSFYGFDNSINTIQHASVILGLQSIKILVLGLAAIPELKAMKLRGFNPVKYWQRSLYAACAARILAPRAGVDHEICFHAALLMDIGMLALDQALGEAYGRAVAQARSHGELAAIEQATLGITHIDASRVLAEQWNLPEMLAVPIGCHDRETAVENEVYQKVTEVVSLAGRCADIFVDESSVWSIADVRRSCMQRYSLDQISADSMLCSIGQRTREMAPLFEIRLDEDRAYETILEKANRELLELTSVGTQEASERRRAPRVKRQSKAQILICADGGLGETVDVLLQDVSARGLGFMHARDIAPGTQFVLQIAQTHARPIRLLYEVVRSHKRGAQFWIGAELQCVLSDTPAPADDAASPTEASIRSAVLS